jgi:capsular polysaccharide biosynthesis protein
MDLRNAVSLIRAAAPIVVAVTLVGAIVGFAVSLVTPASYESKATLLVGQALTSPAIDYNDILAAKELAQTYAEVATTTPLVTAAAARLDPEMDPGDFAKAVHVRAPASSTFVEITADATTAKQAAAIANALAAELLSRVPSRVPVATPAPDASGSPSPSAGPVVGTGSLALVEPATAPSSPASPRLLVNVGAGAVVGFLLAGALAVALFGRSMENAWR